MRQIGVRDEAKMLGGYGTCGRPLCCTTFLHVVRAGVDQDGEAAGPEPQPVEAVRAVRPAEVLPALRAAERQRRACTAAAAAKAAATTRPAAARGGCGSGSCGPAAAAAARTTMTKPRIAITVGDPAGIGPEIAARAAARSRACSRSASRSCTRRRRRAAFAPGVLERRRPAARRTTRSCAPSTMRSAASWTRSRRRRSTRKRSGWPGCRGAATPICSRT